MWWMVGSDSNAIAVIVIMFMLAACLVVFLTFKLRRALGAGGYDEDKESAMT